VCCRAYVNQGTNEYKLTLLFALANIYLQHLILSGEVE
jgi:hypothetical protein